ncbi:uncharacterized protein LOC116805006 [Drosophila grimshawi]|uniref:uncharacterized protein LOC116805006 n=1 Tax=Drosophila grimshawi TaxID=7222 RepID=UPI000C870E02|nr:uncharacterized protein LOC116805006 [Drosophila grimshawi]
MLLSKRNRLIASGPIAMGLALATFAIPDYEVRDLMDIVRAVQLLATILLLYGIYKKNPQHKDKFLLIWLVITTFFLGVLCYCNIVYITNDLFDFYDFGSFFLLFLGFLVLLAATGLLAYIMYCVYQEFEELPNSSSVSNPVANETIGIVTSTDLPPSYATTGNLAVSILN